jgi:hypothetical protein
MYLIMNIFLENGRSNKKKKKTKIQSNEEYRTGLTYVFNLLNVQI